MTRGWFRGALVVALGLGTVLAACDDSNDSSDAGGELEVVTAFYPVFEAAQRVGGRDVSVTNLTPAGTEPHDLELTPQQVETVLDADLAIVLGNGFQPAVEEIAADREGATLELLGALPIDAEGKRVEEEEGEHAEEGAESPSEEDALDPHVWLDPVLFADVVDQVADALAEADPNGAEVYRENAATYRAEVEDLDTRFRDGLANCERDLLVTSHEAFGWLAQRYGLTQEGIAGLSPEAEPDAQRLGELADLAAREGVTTIFTETLVSPEIAETLAREAGGLQTATLNPLEGLTEEEVDAGENYVSVMESNLASLRTALGCE